MCNKFLYLATLFAVVYIVNSETPSFITKCKESDAKCYRENAVKLADTFGAGLPEYNVESMDPLKIDRIDASSNNLKLILNDVTVSGLSKCDIKKLQRNVEKKTLVVTLLCNLNLVSKYDMKGKLSVFPIEGDGNARAQIRAVEINGEAKMPEFVGKDGKKHWKIPSWTHSFELHGESDVEFDNLFKGNKELSAAVNDFISKNGNIMINEVGEPVVNAIIAKLAENVSHFFKKFSVEDLSEQ